MLVARPIYVIHYLKLDKDGDDGVLNPGIGFGNESGGGDSGSSTEVSVPTELVARINYQRNMAFPRCGDRGGETL